ncbi:MAG: 4-hydroxy-tetrahydrodipicolinate reductase, partial [Clostridia bacterium]|nr:4-hydroxy-tetrahydrodipicolinate reductase [Clostridia bacterium]
MKIIVNGACGRMGAELIRQIDSSNTYELVCGADIRADGT